MSTTTREVDDYVTAVHAALADLPDSEREDLLDDLPQHLADVQADRGGSLVELLGTPQDYAAELRATAGLDADPQGRPWWQTTWHRLAVVDERVGAALGYARLVDLLRALAPGWWIVRAYLLVQVCTNAVQHSGARALLVEARGNRVLGVALVVLAVAVSVWLGRRRLTPSWQRVAIAVLGLALAAYGVALVHHASDTSVIFVNTNSGSDDYDGYGTDPSTIQNVYPVGSDGTVLKNVRLYDQDGNPITLGSPCNDGSGPMIHGVNETGGEIFSVDGIPQPTQEATTAPEYPLTCPVNQGPFPSGTTSALPATSSPASSASATPSAPSASPSR